MDCVSHVFFLHVYIDKFLSNTCKKRNTNFPNSYTKNMCLCIEISILVECVNLKKEWDDSTYECRKDKNNNWLAHNRMLLFTIVGQEFEYLTSCMESLYMFVSEYHSKEISREKLVLG